MSIALNELRVQNSIASGEKLIVAGTTAEVQIDYDVLAKAIVEQWSGSTLAGSSQSVKSAIDAAQTTSETLNTNIAELQTRISQVASGTPEPVNTIAEMTDHSKIYVYTGSEQSESTGYWYSYDSTQEKFVPRGEYGEAVTSTTFNRPGVPADDFAVGQALAGKAYADDVESLTEDIADLKDDLSRAQTETLSAYATDTASGSIASFSDGADGVPVKRLMVGIEPVQAGSGDPSPTNIRSISGHTQAKLTRCGDNLIPKPTWETRTNSGITATLLDDGQVSVSGIFTGTGFSIITYNTVTLPKGSYILNGQNGVDSANKLLTLQLFNKTTNTQIANRDVASDFSFTLNERTSLEIRIGIRVGASVTDAVMSPMIRAATDADSSFEARKADGYTINLGGTRYGGTLDVTTGLLTIDRVYMSLTADYWTVFNASKIAFTNSSYLGNLIEMCDSLVAQSGAPSAVGRIGVRTSDGRIGAMPQWAQNFTSLGEFKTALADNPINVVMRLAEPQTVQLTAIALKTYLGWNNIYSDTGDVVVEYRADTKLYIQKLTGSTETDMIADTNIPNNTYFMVGNTLYFSTAAIASGTIIIPGSNCTLTNLATALNMLNQ